ncbi:hypothetical protein A3D78_07590 [Candidatus Gottesmanbacteria bacterium RIFCSPHIGHO2_02_FULL_39_14]|uniref:Peptidase C51 domain-containing protein n=1 Tax=Candidatus Gottesmanbacteria bacterium RIFCSPHIGHO2_02_FULL_39_14 TaxID=1798383 RepID=A0A1F6A2W8_9BACT|nr:MAG: hypothetical protein A3D78_07590 [Candidatus Gottesmanbacteria bacterium RIFCSPHIGHO2_02_FULL_39_14]
MPKRVLLFIFLLVSTLLISHHSIRFVNALSPTPPKTIKFGSFTPPSKTPTPTRPPPSPTSPSVPTPTGGADPTDEPGSGKVMEIIDLVNQIRNYCPNGIVTIDNLSCVNNLVLPKSVDTVVKSELKFSAIWNTYLQCVGFVRAATARVDGSPVNNGGDAIDFATNLPTGYIFIDKNSGVKIRKQDLPIWDYDTYGHIAYVVEVQSGNVFQVAEANLGISGRVRLNNTTIDNPNLIGWIRKV